MTPTNQKLIKCKIGFIGGGNMAKAICEGIVAKGLSTYSQIYVSGPHIENLDNWKKLGANISVDNGRVVEQADVIFLATKPHVLPTAIANIYETISDVLKLHNKLFVSILAGITLEALENVRKMLRVTEIVLLST